MANIAYLRVSTIEQETSRQFKNDLSQFDKTFEDKLSGATLNRPALTECLEYLNDGDTLHVHEISRLSRSTIDLATTVNSLLERGINLKFHKEGLEFCADMCEPMKAAVSKMMMTLLGAIAEFEREMISARTKEALAIKKAQGVKLGAAAEKYDRNPNNATKRNRQDALERVKYLREPLKNIIFMLRKAKELSLAAIASALNGIGYNIPSGKEGNWKSSQVSRVLKTLGINMYQLN